ncbi:MAG: LppX_LprAFG lipoprotein [Ilumatobacteraceae bacterium]
MVIARPARRWLVAGAMLLAACGGGDGEAEPIGPTIPPDPEVIVAASAAAMGEVESVRFEVERTGAPVYIDSFESIALNTIVGEFSVPHSARALLEVEVDGSLTTELGAVAIDDDIWLSNPVTGEFEPLPAGFDLDPSRFFDPQDGWRPLLADLEDVELVGIEDRDGTRYHVRGTASAEQVEVITAGLVRDQAVVADFWIQPVTGLVHAAEFTTTFRGGSIDWSLELSEFGEPFEITPPVG